MNPRNRRALWLLGLWLAGLALYLGGQRAWQFHRRWRWIRERIHQCGIQRKLMEAETLRLRREREAHAVAMPRVFVDLNEDQVRLKGQGAMLAACEAAKLKGVKLRNEPGSDIPGFRNFRWSLEGEGSLSQWVEAMEKIESSTPLMTIGAIRFEAVGDPWGAGIPGVSEGPMIKGTVLCSWFTYVGVNGPLGTGSDVGVGTPGSAKPGGGSP